MYKTMTFMLQLLRPGEKLLPRAPEREPDLAVFKGAARARWASGSSTGKASTPSVSRAASGTQHANASEREDAILFIASDEPTVRTLGFSLKHGRKPSGELVTLESCRA